MITRLSIILNPIYDSVVIKLENIFISLTKRTPEINFDFTNGFFSIKGESYPGNALSFFGPIIAAFDTYLQNAPHPDLVFNIEMEYFNSSSAKALMNIFQLADEAAKAGTSVTICWCYKKDDYSMKEFGEDFSENLKFLTFKMVGLG